MPDPREIENWTGNDLINYINENKTERRNLDFKSGKFTANKSETEIKEFLSKSASAFANSEGGLLIIGVGDEGSITKDDTVTLKYKNDTAKWIEDIIFKNTSPPITDFSAYIFDSNELNKSDLNLAFSDETGIIVFVFSVGHVAHEAMPHKKFFYRRGSSSEPADGWLVNVIANRKRAPAIEGHINLDLPSHVRKKVKIKSDANQVNLILFLKNTGFTTCNRACIEINFPEKINFNEVYNSGWASFSSENVKGGEKYTFYTPKNFTIFPGQVFGYWAIAEQRYMNDEKWANLKNCKIEYQIFTDNCRMRSQILDVKKDCSHLFDFIEKLDLDATDKEVK